MVIVNSLHCKLLELVVGLIYNIGEDGLKLLDAGVELFFIETRLCVIEVCQLKGGFYVLGGAGCLNAVPQGVDERIDRNVLSCQHLAYGGVGEACYAGISKICREDSSVEACHVLCRDEAFTAVL